MGVIIPQHIDTLVNNTNMITSYIMLNMSHFQYCELNTRTDHEHILRINLPSCTLLLTYFCSHWSIYLQGQPSLSLLGDVAPYPMWYLYKLFNSNDVITIICFNASRLNTNFSQFKSYIQTVYIPFDVNAVSKCCVDPAILWFPLV